jgi:hypothetical protein
MGPEQTKKNRSTNLKISPNIPLSFFILNQNKNIREKFNLK